jgi:hypothetical protein
VVSGVCGINVPQSESSSELEYFQALLSKNWHDCAPSPPKTSHFTPTESPKLIGPEVLNVAVASQVPGETTWIVVVVTEETAAFLALQLTLFPLPDPKHCHDVIFPAVGKNGDSVLAVPVSQNVREPHSVSVNPKFPAALPHLPLTETFPASALDL